MILEATLPCCYLLLTSVCSIYQLKNYSCIEYSKIFPHFILVFIGFASLGIQSLHCMLFKIFVKSYTIDPMLIEIEEEENELKVNIFDQILDIIGRGSLTSSLFFHHKYYLSGINIIVTFLLTNIYHLRRLLIFRHENQDLVTLFYERNLYDPVLEIFIQFGMLFNGYIMWLNGNNYGLLANYSYVLTRNAFPIEGFYQGWTMRRAIGNYMTTVYVMLLTEAFQQPC